MDTLRLVNQEIFVDDVSGHGFLAFDVVISISDTGFDEANYTTAQFDLVVMGVDGASSSGSGILATSNDPAVDDSELPFFDFTGLWGNINEADVYTDITPLGDTAIKFHWDIGMATGQPDAYRAPGDYTVAMVLVDLGSTPSDDLTVAVSGSTTKLATDSQGDVTYGSGLEVEIFGMPATVQDGDAVAIVGFADAVTPPELMAKLIGNRPADQFVADADLPDSVMVKWEFSKPVTAPVADANPVGLAPNVVQVDGVWYATAWEKSVDTTSVEPADVWSLSVEPTASASEVVDQYGNSLMDNGHTATEDLAIVLTGDTLAPTQEIKLFGDWGALHLHNSHEYYSLGEWPSVVATQGIDLWAYGDQLSAGDLVYVKIGDQPAFTYSLADFQDPSNEISVGNYRGVNGETVVVQSWLEDAAGNQGPVSSQSLLIDTEGPTLESVTRLTLEDWKALDWAAVPSDSEFDDGGGSYTFEGWYRFDFSEPVGGEWESFSSNDLSISGLDNVGNPYAVQFVMSDPGSQTYIVQVQGDVLNGEDVVVELRAPAVDRNTLYEAPVDQVTWSTVPQGVIDYLSNASAGDITASNVVAMSFTSEAGAGDQYGFGDITAYLSGSTSTGADWWSTYSAVDWSTNTLYVTTNIPLDGGGVTYRSFWGEALGASITDSAGNLFSWDEGVSETVTVDMAEGPFGSSFAPEGPKGFDVIVLNGFDGRLTVDADAGEAFFKLNQQAALQDFKLDNFNGYVFEYDGVDWYGTVGSEKVVVGATTRTLTGDQPLVNADDVTVNNIFYANSNPDDSLEIDTISYQQFDSASGGIKVLLQDVVDGVGVASDDIVLTNDGNDTVRDSISGFRGVVGSQADDAITGNSQANYLGGMDGADTLIGGAGTDILVGGAGDDTIIGGEGRDLLIDFDGSTLQGRATTDTSDKDIFVVRRDSVIQNFELSPSGTRLAGRSGDHADALVLSVAVDRILDSAVLNQTDGLAEAVQAVKDAGGGQDEMEMAAGEWLLKEGALSFKFVRTGDVPGYEIAAGDLGVIAVYNTEAGQEAGIGFVTIQGLATQLDATIPEGGTAEDGDTVTAVRIQHFDPQELLDANFDPDVTQMAMHTIFEGSALLIPIALEQVRAGTLGVGSANERGVMAGDMGLAQRIYNPGAGDQTMVGGIQGKDIIEVLTQNFSDEQGNPVTDSGRDRVFDYGGEDLLYIADVDMNTVEFEAVATGKGATANSLRVSFEQSRTEGDVTTDNTGDITWAGHFANRGKQFLETIKLGNDEYAMGALSYKYEGGIATGEITQTASGGQDTIMVGRKGERDVFVVELNADGTTDNNDIYIWNKGNDQEDLLKVMDGDTVLTGVDNQDGTITYTGTSIDADVVVVHLMSTHYAEEPVGGP
jgi:hypothetical protein